MYFNKSKQRRWRYYRPKPMAMLIAPYTKFLHKLLGDLGELKKWRTEEDSNPRPLDS